MACLKYLKILRECSLIARRPISAPSAADWSEMISGMHPNVDIMGFIIWLSDYLEDDPGFIRDAIEPEDDGLYFVQTPRPVLIFNGIRWVDHLDAGTTIYLAVLLHFVFEFKLPSTLKNMAAFLTGYFEPDLQFGKTNLVLPLRVKKKLSQLNGTK